MAASHFGLERQLGISVGIEQAIEFGCVGDGDLVDPATGFGIGIDQAGIAGEFFIDRGDGARNGSVDFGSRFHGFDDSSFAIHTAPQLTTVRMPLLEADSEAEAEAETATGPSALLEGGSISAFRPGVDDAEWIALNALVFATHPEQGAITADDLVARQAESWFSNDDFLILRDGHGRMIGYNWLKVDGAIGEIYVVGVHPDAAGHGFGRALMQKGLQRLRSAGCATAALYVEADSIGAVHLYRSLGFNDHTVDVQYRRLAD